MSTSAAYIQWFPKHVTEDLLIGRRVHHAFDNAGMFAGVVTEYNPRFKQYRVKFSDGDRFWYNEKQILESLVQPNRYFKGTMWRCPCGQHG